MNIEIRKIFRITILPAFLLACGFIFIPQLTKSLPNLIIEILPYMPFIIVFIGMGLSWIFHHSREFNLFILFIVLFISLDQYIWKNPSGYSLEAYLLLVTLVPINFILNFILKERGILNQFGIRRIVILVIQLYLITWLLENPYPQVKEFLTFTYFKHSYFNLTPISQPLLAAILFTGVIVLFQLIRTASTLSVGVLFSLISITAALHYFQQPQLATFFILLACILLIVSITFNAYSLAYLDELTNLPSRRALMQSITTLGKRYSIAMVDVDHFKKFNDKYGHDIGDQVLKKLASQLRQVRNGKAFRYGGEEFTLLFPNKNLHEARLFCNELCKNVAENPFMLRSKKRPKVKTQTEPVKAMKNETIPLLITISIGVSERTQELHTAEAVIKQADIAMYKAKNNGRNQVAT